jgi:hypothetical protein
MKKLPVLLLLSVVPLVSAQQGNYSYYLLVERQLFFPAELLVIKKRIDIVSSLISAIFH